MAVRSRRLFGPATVTAGTTGTVYTVPAGRTAVFRLVTVRTTGTGTAEVLFRINSTVAGGFFGLIPAGVAQSVELLHDLVLDPADFLAVTAPANVTVQISGFGSLLDGAPS